MNRLMACLRNMLDCPVKGCIWKASGERMDTMQLHYKKMHLGYPPNHKLTLEEKTELYRLLNEAENPPTDKAMEGTEMDSSPMELDESDHDDDRLDQHSAESWTSGATDMDVPGRTVAPGRYAHSTPGSRASSVMSTTSSESVSSRSSSSSETTAMDVDCSDEDESLALSRHAAAMKVRGRGRGRDRPPVDEEDNRGRSRTRTPLQPSIPVSEAEYRRKRVDRSAARAHPSRRDHSAFPTHFHPSQLIAPRPPAQLQVSDGDSSDGL
ncbi:hypothetical protein BC629DRAFT_1536108 [Irpex lacteus]|nr:hypothetical protein BC629DRAFT_1536108 [Irpex lacteus]